MASTATQTSAAPKRSASGKTSRKAPKADRARMIAEAAYYLAEQRGFAAGDPVKDWLDAETMIDQMTAKPKRKAKAS